MSLTPVGDWIARRYPPNDGSTHYLGAGSDPGCCAGPHPACTYDAARRETLRLFAAELVAEARESVHEGAAYVNGLQHAARMARERAGATPGHAEPGRDMAEGAERGPETGQERPNGSGPVSQDAETVSVDLSPARPRIVCLCGSSRFYDEYQEANYERTMAGEIVLSVGFYPHAKAQHGHGEGVGHDSAQKVALDELHKRKVDLADEVLVVSDASGYFGQSTIGEITYAVSHGKPVRFWNRATRQRALELGLVLEAAAS